VTITRRKKASIVVICPVCERTRLVNSQDIKQPVPAAKRGTKPKPCRQVCDDCANILAPFYKDQTFSWGDVSERLDDGSWYWIADARGILESVNP